VAVFAIASNLWPHATNADVIGLVIVLPEVEDKVWPFVISVMPPELSVEFFERYFAKQQELLNRKERWVHLVDVRLVSKLPDARVRAAVGDHTKRIEDLSARYNIGTATVIASPLVRGMLTAIHWIMPPPHPFSNVATPVEGIDWLRNCLQKADMHVPSRMCADLVEIVQSRVVPRNMARAAHS
jgi:hypothetical protein